MKYLILIGSLMLVAGPTWAQSYHQHHPRDYYRSHPPYYFYHGPPVTRTPPTWHHHTPAKRCYRTIVSYDRWNLPIYGVVCH